MFFGSVRLAWLMTGALWVALMMWLDQRARKQRPTWLAAGDLLAGGSLFLLTVGFFWRTLSGEVYQPADGGDLVSFLYPTYRFAASQIQQWTLPLWNPTLYGGAPFIGDIQAGFLYLPNLLLFMLWPDFPYHALQWLTIGHLYWAGLGMYTLLRTWRWREDQAMSRGAALFGALAFQFSDPLLIHLGNLNLIAVLSWLPWCLAAYHQALTQRNYRWTAVAALLFALSTYAGHAQSTFYVALTIGLYTLGDWVMAAGQPSHFGEDESTPGRWRLMARVQYPLLFYGLGALLIAPILLPALQLSTFTERSTFTYQDTVAFSLAPTQAIGLLTPSFFGRGPALHWSLWARVELPYAGVATLILALGALFLADHNVRRRLLPWIGIALFGFVTALGIYAIVHGWLTTILPLFGQFRAPARALVLWTFSLAILSAVGIDLVGRSISTAMPAQSGLHPFQQMLKRGMFILLGVVMPLAYFSLLLTQSDETAFLRASVAALALTFVIFFWLGTWATLAIYWHGWLGAQGLAWALVGLLFFDLAATGAYTDISPSDPTRNFVHPELVAFLRNHPEPMRIDTLTDIDDLWQPDTAALYGLQDVGGIANPLVLADWRTFWAALGGRQSSLYDLLNVHYVLVQDGTPLPEGKFELALDAPGPLALYRNLTPLPRAWLVHEMQSVDTLSQAIVAMQKPDFDPRRQAMIHNDASAPTLTPATAAEQVQITHYGANQIRLQAEASAPALLVLSEIWYPGWQAEVDGVPTTILRANGLLRAVSVPSGVSQVTIRFIPFGWRAGWIAFALGCCLVCLLEFGKSIRYRRGFRERGSDNRKP